MFLQTTLAMQCRSFTSDCGCCHTQYDPGRCELVVSPAQLIFMVSRVDLCRVLTTFGRSWIPSGILLAASSSHLAQTLSVARALVSCNVISATSSFSMFASSLIRLSLTFCDSKQMSKMSTSWLHNISCSCPQPAESTHHNLRDLSSDQLLRTCPCPQRFRADLTCLPAPSGIRCWTDPQSPPPELLNSSLIVSFTFPRLQPSSCGCPPARVLPAASAVSLLELCMLPLLRSVQTVFLVRRSNLRCRCLYKIIVHDVLCSCSQYRCFLSDLHTWSVVLGQCTPYLVSAASPLAAAVVFHGSPFISVNGFLSQR